MDKCGKKREGVPQPHAGQYKFDGIEIIIYVNVTNLLISLITQNILS